MLPSSKAATDTQQYRKNSMFVVGVVRRCAFEVELNKVVDSVLPYGNTVDDNACMFGTSLQSNQGCSLESS